MSPGYAQEHNRRYPTLYVNDGQDQEALQIRETLAKLFQRRQVPPIIVVAVPSNDDRLQEYGTAVCPNTQNLSTKEGEYGCEPVIKPIWGHYFQFNEKNLTVS